MDTQHFVVSIDEGSSQGVYCAYCGNKITPQREILSGSYIFQCECEDAQTERNLYRMKAETEQSLEHFFEKKTDAMQINELRTRIVVYEQHIHSMKTRLQELMNKAAGVTPEKGVSTLVVKLPKEEVQELIDEVVMGDDEFDVDIPFEGRTDFTIPEDDSHTLIEEVPIFNLPDIEDLE